MLRLILLGLGVAGLSLTACQEEITMDSIEKIDAHIHIRYGGSEVLQTAAANDFQLINILVDHNGFSEQAVWAKAQEKIDPGHIKTITTFTMVDWTDPGWQQSVIDQLKQDFQDGAIAVKVWKNIGMVERKPDGSFLMIDDPVFDPIFAFIEKEDKVLTGHIGEPRDCWLPLDEMIAESNRGYYSRNPQYHMALHPEFPAYEDHIEAVKRMLRKHPDLRYVGCHLASLEWSPSELAKFLDEFPNAAVDMSARIDDLQYLDSQEVRQFCIDYQDRLLYATDLGIRNGDDPDRFCEKLKEVWQENWTYLATDSMVTIRGSEKQARGLDLPAAVLKKIYAENARQWYGLADW